MIGARLHGTLWAVADVDLDTPVALYGMAAGLMFDARPVVAYIRLSPVAEPGTSWWKHQPVVDVDLPLLARDVHQLESGHWDLGRAAVATPDKVRGIVTAQFGVNGAYVAELAEVLRNAGDSQVPWGPVCLVAVGEGLWVVDGHHRAAAAVAAGRRTHPARVVHVETLTSCPCGWTGRRGSWLRHPCSVVTLTEAASTPYGL